MNPFEPRDAFLYAPNEPAAAAPAEPAAAKETPEVPATPSVTSAQNSPPEATTPASSSPSDVAGGTTPAVASAPAPTWLDGFRKEGFNFADENQARQQLAQAYRDSERLKPLAPALSAYQQHAAEFHKYLAEQQKAQAKPIQEEDWTAKLGWNHPEWNPAWQHQITKDEKGNLIPLPGAPADVVLKYQQAQNFRQDFIDKFLTNPAKTLEPYIKHMAEQAAEKYSQQGVGQYKEQQEANKFIDEHSNWLFDKDESGGVMTRKVLNPQTGQHESEKQLSSWGQMFVQKLQYAAQKGLPADLQQEYAMQAVQNAYMATPDYVSWAAEKSKPAAPPAAPAGTPRQQANDKFTQKNNPAAAPAPIGGGNSKPAPRTVNRENLEQIMLERFRAEGVTI
jgi:hypothetical protein